MKKIFLAAMIASLGSVSAFAADLPSRAYTKAPAMVAPAFSWTGFYIGGTAGYGWGDTFQFDTVGHSADHNWNGFVGGGTAGFNWQSGAFVLGLETDISYSDLKASWKTEPGWGCGGLNLLCTNKLDWFGTTRARVGYAFDRLLPYLTVGVGYGRVHGQFGDNCPADGCVTATKTGLAWGGGVEWAFLQNWSAKVEYLRVNLDAVDFQPGPDLGVGKTELNVVRAGVNYKFGPF